MFNDNMSTTDVTWLREKEEDGCKFWIIKYVLQTDCSLFADTNPLPQYRLREPQNSPYYQSECL